MTLRLVGAGFLILSAITGYTIVFLGRHWIIDVVASVPYAVAIAWAPGRLGLKMTLVVTPAPRHSGAVLTRLHQ